MILTYTSARLSMDDVLFVPCYPGELGWELINYVPHINWHIKKKSYNEVHVMIRPGRQGLYPMATHFYETELSDETSMGNNGPRISLPMSLSRLKKKKNVTIVKLPKGGCRYVKHREYLKYIPAVEYLEKWSYLPENLVGLCIRERAFGSYKNWSGKNWNRLCLFLQNKNFYPVLLGMKGTKSFECPDTIDLRNQTTMSDLIAIMSKCKWIIGQSTGTCHLASLCGIRHIVWGSERIGSRYTLTWNPHKTPVNYYSCGQQWSAPYSDIEKFISTVLSKNEDHL